VSYEALSAPVPAAVGKIDLQAAQNESGGSFKVTRYKGLRPPAWLLKLGAPRPGGQLELIVIKDRQYLAGAFVFSSLRKSQASGEWHLSQATFISEDDRLHLLPGNHGEPA